MKWHEVRCGHATVDQSETLRAGRTWRRRIRFEFPQTAEDQRKIKLPYDVRVLVGRDSGRVTAILTRRVKPWTRDSAVRAISDMSLRIMESNEVEDTLSPLEAIAKMRDVLLDELFVEEGK